MGGNEHRLSFLMHIKERATWAQEHLKCLQEKALMEGQVDGTYQQTQKTVAQLSEVEFQFYLQHANNMYFKHVDQNNSFLHSMVKINNRRREILVIERKMEKHPIARKRLLMSLSEASKSNWASVQVDPPYNQIACVLAKCSQWTRAKN